MENLVHESFGNVNTPFQKATLKQFMDNCQINEAKAYMVKYFCCSGKSIYFYDYLRKDIEQYSFAEFKETRVPKDFKCPIIEQGKLEQFVLQTWFLNQFGRECCTTMEVNKPIAYTDNGNYYINLFKGFLHKNRPAQFTEFQMTGVAKVWQHINHVWASDNQVMFAYLKNWVSHMVAGRKMKTCLYLKSGQGTGKSIITEFLQHMVLGEKITHMTKNTKCVSGQFNGELQSKILLILEELPVANVNDWNKLSNDLKTFITNSTIDIEFKGKDKIEVPNILNVILMSNNNALRIDVDDRRTVMPDISNKYKGNHEYFDDLAQYVSDMAVGEAFYFDCLAHAQANPKFNEKIIPHTQNKQDLIVDNLHTLYDFIKFEFIKKGLGINCTFSEFYAKYITYNTMHNNKAEESKPRVSKLLDEIGIEVKAMAQNIKHVVVHASALKSIYLKRKWIHELDDIPLDQGPVKQAPEQVVEQVVEQAVEQDEESEEEPAKPVKSVDITAVKAKLAKTQKLIDNLGQDLKRTTKNAPPDEDVDDTFLILF